tara:strand:+ start:186 stop:575 length:390 start_codon:yes stop_codon:yes gene_type:complete
MKKILLIILLIPFIGFSQTNFSCNFKEFCEWDEVSEKWKQDCNYFENHCLFEMNKGETMFIHTTEKIKSTYYIKEKLSAKDDQFAYNVVSDVGNEYFYLFDIKNKEVKAIIEDENGNSVLIRWYVKSIF